MLLLKTPLDSSALKTREEGLTFMECLANVCKGLRTHYSSLHTTNLLYLSLDMPPALSADLYGRQHLHIVVRGTVLWGTYFKLTAPVIGQEMITLGFSTGLSECFLKCPLFQGQ